MNILRRVLRISSVAAACLMLSVNTLFGQQLVDEISAIVGDEKILLSEIESLVLTQRSRGDRTPAERLRCEILEDMMVQKLFLDQSRIDSIVVTDDEVDRSLNMRLNDFIMTAGSEKNLEDYYNKSMVEIKRDLRKMMKNELLTSEMQQTMAMDITTSPSEVRKFYTSHNPDSMHIYIPLQPQFAHRFLLVLLLTPNSHVSF